MDKSEKCYYVIIKNKKRGKFYGASPSQVAKKVASKKLKAGKEIEFYLDKAGGKNKIYGPYQARKDKKTGKVSVINARKVMKGGLLRISDRNILSRIFNNNCSYSQTANQTTKPFIKQVYFNDIKIYFVAQSVLIFFKKNYEEQIYTHAIFVDPNRIYVWILKKQYNNSVKFISFADFFLNPKYLSQLERKYIINNLNTNILSIRREEANIIRPILSEIKSVVEPLNGNQNKAIYFPDYSRLLIRKCVYHDLTFGILDEETPVRIPRNASDFPTPESPYQKYLIYKNTGISGMSFNEPIIYVRVANIPQNQRGGTPTAQQIQANINRLKLELNSLKTHQSYIKKLVNSQIVLKPQQNVGYKLRSNVLNKHNQNRKLLIELNSEITKIENEIQNIQTRQQQQLQLQPQQFRRSIRTNNNNRKILQELQKELQQQQLHFDYCIFSSGNKLKIRSYNTNNVQEFSLMGFNLISIPIQIFKNLIDIPQLFGEFRRIREISDRRIQQEEPKVFVPQISPESRNIRKVPPVKYQQEPLTIDFFEKKIRDLFVESTGKHSKINIEILSNELKHIMKKLNILKTTYQNNQQNPELQRKLILLYQEFGIIFQEVLRKSQQLRKNPTALQQFSSKI